MQHFLSSLAVLLKLCGSVKTHLQSLHPRDLITVPWTLQGLGLVALTDCVAGHLVLAQYKKSVKEALSGMWCYLKETYFTTCLRWSHFLSLCFSIQLLCFFFSSYFCVHWVDEWVFWQYLKENVFLDISFFAAKLCQCQYYQLAPFHPQLLVRTFAGELLSTYFSHPKITQ